MEIETDFDLFNVFGLETPEGFESMLSLDYFSKRGPAVGVDAEYKRDRYFGLLRGYLLTDSDIDFLGREREEEPERDVRGRFLLRHRQYLEDDWQISLELSYISDRGFLEEFFETEFDNEKEQETLLNLKKQRENRAFTAAVQSRLLDFTTQTERLPDFGLHLAGEPLGDRWTWFSENRLGGWYATDPRTRLSGSCCVTDAWWAPDRWLAWTAGRTWVRRSMPVRFAWCRLSRFGARPGTIRRLTGASCVPSELTVYGAACICRGSTPMFARRFSTLMGSVTSSSRTS